MFRFVELLGAVLTSPKTISLLRHNVAAIRAAAETWASAVPPGQLQASPAVSVCLQLLGPFWVVSIRLTGQFASKIQVYGWSSRGEGSANGEYVHIRNHQLGADRGKTTGRYSHFAVISQLGRDVLDH